MLRAEWVPRPQAENIIACLHLLSQDPHEGLLYEVEPNPDVTGRELVSEVDHAAKLVHSLRIEKEVGVCVARRVPPADQVFA